ncbi:MAG: FAD-dependent oxidoreductase [Acidimicrobiales bacterium]
MSEHAHRRIERHCDVAVVGGSAAGLAAALQLGRQRRSVIVIDAGHPRNAPAAHLHGYLGREGASPQQLLDIGRHEVRSYGGEVLAGRVVSVHRSDDGGFHLDLVGGTVVVARRVLAATGLVDDLPDIPGLSEHWGTQVIHCPFCHGYEVRDQRIVQILTHPVGLHPATLFRQLSDRLTLVLHDGVDVAHAELDALRRAGVGVEDHRVARLEAGEDGRLRGVRLDDGRLLDADAVVVSPRFRVDVAPYAPLGLTAEPHPIGLGDSVVVDATGVTSVPGLYAAGNLVDPSQQLLHAAANGSKVGAMISAGMAAEDVATTARPSANEADWDRRYGEDRMWSGNPNGTLVAEVSDLDPGRALDVGAGEGGDAVWLAERGWTVTASDISGRALERVAAEAERRGLSIDCLRVDANATDAFGSGAFDLVSAQYASIPRTPDGRALRNLLDAVAPGGTLLVVSHDLAPMRAPVDTAQHSRAFDADAYVRVEDVVATLGADPHWDIVRHETRPRPPGAASASHHVDDIVLRARRRP